MTSSSTKHTADRRPTELVVDEAMDESFGESEVHESLLVKIPAKFPRAG